MRLPTLPDAIIGPGLVPEKKPLRAPLTTEQLEQLRRIASQIEAIKRGGAK